jgi:lysophospholipase L1-like esterase
VSVSRRDVVPAAVRLMPLGDSITFGYGDEANGGYRGPLGALLAGAGHSIEFVGSQSDGAIPQPRHEGHSGWCADQVREDVYQWLTASPPDLVLLHIGTNSISREDGAEAVAGEIDGILNEIDRHERAAGRALTVVLAQIVNRRDSEMLAQETTKLNARIASLAEKRRASGDRLMLADVEHALAYPDDLFMDDYPVHPNANGYARMAQVWFDVLGRVLGSPRPYAGDGATPAR